MFARIRDWFREQKAWRREHEIAWAIAADQGPDQLTTFQRLCKETLERAVPGLNFEVKQGEHERYLVAELPNAKAQLFVYLDGANIEGEGIDFRAEEWDFKTPEELIEAVVNKARKRLAI